MQDMVEPDRTIVIVSLIGLVVIWGSVLYHKVVQGGGGAETDEASVPAQEAPAEPAPNAEQADKRKKNKNRKRK